VSEAPMAHPGDLLEPSDDQLISRTLSGDQKSYEILVKRYQKRVYRLAQRMVRDPDAADDVAQEAFIRAYYALNRYEQGRNFYFWLSRIAVNLALNHLSREKRFVELPEDDANLAPELATDPTSEADASQLKARIGKAIEDLPLHQRSVLLLRAQEGLSYQEIAQALSISIGTVMSRLSRARQVLKDALGDSLSLKGCRSAPEPEPGSKDEKHRTVNPNRP
jgi:RNA polymerase sigma-70 factor (ECF subfamily)